MRKQSLGWKILAIAAALALLAGCAGNSAGEEGQPDSGTEQDSGQNEEPSDSGSGVLVAYYSATGNTKAVAEAIADALGGDLFAMVPVEPYTDDDLNYNDQNSRVSREHADESLQSQVELESVTVENWDSYSTVFIGYPIWWGSAAWPVNQFITSNDFTGKKVIPFCTSASSPLGQSGQKLAEMAGTGEWQQGMRFRSHPSEEEVAEWAKSAAGE